MSVENKSATAKTQLIKKFFSTINSFGGATTPSKFEGIIHSTFTSEASIEVATSLAREKGINVNSDLKRQGMKSDWAVVIKKISINTPKDMIITAFAELGQANLLVSKWLFLIGKNSVCIAKAVDQFRALLFILLVGTIAHNLGTFLERTGGKTCIINRSLETGNKICYAVVGFEFDDNMEFTKMNMVWCKKYRKFGHSALECDAPVVSPFEPSRTFKKIVSDGHHLQLTKLYEKKSVSISCSTVFGSKSWAQVVSLAGFSSGFHFSFGSSFSLSLSGASDSNIGFSLTLANNSFLNAHLAILECLLELLTDQVSGILKKLSGIELVPIATSSCVPLSVTPTSLVLHLNVNIVMDDMSLISAPSLSAVDDVVHNSSSSFFKVLTSKMGGLESKMVSISLVLENSPSISISSLVWKVAMCNVKNINNPAKQKDIIINKFDGVQVFTSGLESGYLGANITIIMDAFLAKHACKVFEMSGQLISVKLLFKNKLSVMVLGLYTDATLEKRLVYSYVINSIVVEALNGSTFVVLGGDFNKNDFGHSMAIDKCIKAFVNNKSQMIRSVLEKPFKKVTLDHLVDDRDLVLEPDLVKGREMHKQFSPFNYVDDGVFSGMMNQIDFDEFSLVVKDFLDGKAAGLFGISNEMWKHYNESVLVLFLHLLNLCLEKVLTNTRLIAFIETSRKILSKILSDHILRACSTHNVLRRDNFSVLKDTSTQSSIFVVDFVVEDALEKNRKLWLVLQDMRKTYDSRIKMCEKFVRFFGHIYNGHTNRIIMDFGLSKNYKVHNNLDQKEIDSKFMARTGKIEFNVGLTSYLAAGVFIDNTIWVGNYCTVTQKILNISKKTVAIPINPRTSNTSLEVSRSPISITKVGEAHQYLGIFLSTKDLSGPSLKKTNSDIKFFSSIVLHKAITDKQFSYLVSAVLQPIVKYRTQFSFINRGTYEKWDHIIRKGLKSKASLPKNFPNEAVHYLFFYYLKPFEQVQAEAKVLSVLQFANDGGLIGQLFGHRSIDLQVLGWVP
ncbi:hypothetical protein G9A89_018876 [Geosiphon pyriformis]|nr:hypothetical protein G9A89_018876 [Geosiphon pyriformis]